MRGRRFLWVTFVILSCIPVLAEPFPVHYAEGLVHGFLSLRTTDGALVANGDLIQSVKRGLVTSRLVFHFKDGSLSDETSVFSQQQSFRLISNHLVQKGPTFPQPLDLKIDCASGQVTVRYTDDHGHEKVESERMKLPPRARERHYAHAAEEHPGEERAAVDVDGGGHAKAAAREARIGRRG